MRVHWVHHCQVRQNLMKHQFKIRKCMFECYTDPSTYFNFKHPKSLWLVVDLPLWKRFVSWDDEIPNIWKNKNHVPNHQSEIRSGFIQLSAVSTDANGGATKRQGANKRRPRKSRKLRIIRMARRDFKALMRRLTQALLRLLAMQLILVDPTYQKETNECGFKETSKTHTQ